MLFPLHLLWFLLVKAAYASLFCPYTNYPSNDADFRTMSIQIKERAEQLAMYRISDDEFDQVYSEKSDEFRLFNSSDNNECPSRVCLTELSAAEPKHHGSILYSTSVVGKVIPPGFQALDSSRKIYCSIVEGDCGATIPIYRFYTITSQGIYHAYAIGDHDQISNYTREPTPLCFAWSKQKVSTNATSITTTTKNTPTLLNKENPNRLLEETCSDKMPLNGSIKILHLYDNNRSGTMRDHYYTTKTVDVEKVKDVNNVYYNYTLLNNVGSIVVDKKAANCNCLLKLSQVMDHSDKIINILDHKFIMQNEGVPSPGGLINHTATGEELFCAKEEGACGATLPLRKYFHIGDLDTIYTVNTTEIPLFTIPTPGILCYIWNVDDAKNLEHTYKSAETVNILGARYIIDSKNNSLKH